MFTEVKIRYLKKLDNLVEKNRPKVVDSFDLSGKQLKKLVINISKYKLTKDETDVLVNVLNFVVAPERIPHDEFIVATKLAAMKLITQHLNKEPSVADELRSEVVDFLSKSQPLKQNRSKDEWKQITCQQIRTRQQW